MTLSEWLNKTPWTATSNRTITIDFDALEKLFDSRETLAEALMGLTKMEYSDGTRCFCYMPPMSPGAVHSTRCGKARAALAKGEAI